MSRIEPREAEGGKWKPCLISFECVGVGIELWCFGIAFVHSQLVAKHFPQCV